MEEIKMSNSLRVFLSCSAGVFLGISIILCFVAKNQTNLLKPIIPIMLFFAGVFIMFLLIVRTKCSECEKKLKGGK